MMRHLQRVYCAFAGHQYWLGRGSDRLFLKCSQCGRETAGIMVGADEEPPRTSWFRRAPRRPDAARAHTRGTPTTHH
jgi:hypothetical protein